MLALYTLTYFIWTVGAIPYDSLGAEMSDDYDERVKVIAVRKSCALVGLLATTTLPAYLMYSYGGVQGYSVLSRGIGYLLLYIAGFWRSGFW